MEEEKLQISLASARVNAGMTQKEAARKLKVSKQTLVNWDSGKTEPKASRARELSELYNMPLKYIFLAKDQIKFDIGGNNDYRINQSESRR